MSEEGSNAEEEANLSQEEAENEAEEVKESQEDFVNAQKAKDKEFFKEFLEWIKNQISLLEGGSESLRNKKQKGNPKKIN